MRRSINESMKGNTINETAFGIETLTSYLLSGRLRPHCFACLSSWFDSLLAVSNTPPREALNTSD